jgi:hypothetical protein
MKASQGPILIDRQNFGKKIAKESTEVSIHCSGKDPVNAALSFGKRALSSDLLG